MFGGSQKDSGVAINTANVFSALEKKKKNKKKASKKESTKKASEFWTKAPVAVKSWADCEDDDDDYYATVPPIWGHDHKTEKEESDKEESDDQEDYDIDNYADEETEENGDNDTKASLDMKSVVTLVPHLNKTKEPEKQLSKKEIKKKELAELDKVLEEFGFLPKDNSNMLAGSDHSQNKKVEEDSKEDLDSKPSSAIITENKTKRKRKTKKDISKEEKGGSIANGNIQEQVLESKPEANADFANPKAVLKKLASQQKKKSGKESDVAAKAAASEAAARAAKLAAAKKKEKIHYNQHPSK